jgi:hypothetical protein
MKPLTSITYSLLFVSLLTTMSFMPYKKHMSKTVAFKATYSASREIIDPAPMLKQRITGIGVSSALNISKYVAITTQNGSMPPPFTVSGTATFYADNGEMFYTTFEGASTPQADGTLSIEMTHTIKGGTGTLEHATGSFTGKTNPDPKKSSATITFEGKITY